MGASLNVSLGVPGLGIVVVLCAVNGGGRGNDVKLDKVCEGVDVEFGGESSAVKREPLRAMGGVLGLLPIGAV